MFSYFLISFVLALAYAFVLNEFFPLYLKTNWVLPVPVLLGASLIFNGMYDIKRGFVSPRASSAWIYRSKNPILFWTLVGGMTLLGGTMAVLLPVFVLFDVIKLGH